MWEIWYLGQDVKHGVAEESAGSQSGESLQHTLIEVLVEARQQDDAEQGECRHDHNCDRSKAVFYAVHLKNEFTKLQQNWANHTQLTVFTLGIGDLDGCRCGCCRFSTSSFLIQTLTCIRELLRKVFWVKFKEKRNISRIYSLTYGFPWAECCNVLCKRTEFVAQLCVVRLLRVKLNAGRVTLSSESESRSIW